MKKVIWIVLLMLLLLQTAEAANLPGEVRDALPPQAEDLLDEIKNDSTGMPDMLDGLARIWNLGCELLQDMVREELSSVVLLMGVLLLCALAEDCFQSLEGSAAPELIPIVGGLSVVMIAVGDLRSLMGLGVEVMEELNTFSKALLPTLCAAVAASGGVISAGVRHVAAVLFADMLMTLIRQTLLPMVYLYVAVVTADLLVPGKRLLTLAGGMKKVTAWLLTGVLALYTAYLTLAGVAAGTADTVSVRLTRSVMSAVPVVGGIISDAAGAVLAGAAALRGTIGIAGLLAVLAICLAPFLHLVLHYLLYKLAAFFAGTFGSKGLVELVDALGSAFGLVLGMAGACAALLVISVMSSVMAVTT